VPAEGPNPNPVKKRTTWHIRLAASSTALLLIAVVAWRIDLCTPREMHSPAITIAVLPFANYSTDEAERLLAARITDGVTTELARIGTLGVVSHTSARRFADVRRPLREVAQELSADVVMEGRLLTDADGVRVEARLVDAKLDRKFWVEYFVGNMTEVRDLQLRIAAAAATTIAGPRPRLYPESIR
jgi:TolB-like protein